MKTTLRSAAVAVIIAACLPSLPAAEKLPGPLLKDLGDLHHPITSRSERAQRYFDQGIRLVFGFNHKEAIRSFRSAAHLDPQCAMAHWGVAYAYGPHVNKQMDAGDTEAAWAALQLALANRAAAGPKEQAYIDALQARYQPDHREDRSALDKAFADAMRELVRVCSSSVSGRLEQRGCEVGSRLVLTRPSRAAVQAGGMFSGGPGDAA